jgi:hypothetical protein
MRIRKKSQRKVARILEISREKMIVARMASRLDASKNKREHFGSHKRPKESPDKPLSRCTAGGTGPSAGKIGIFLNDVNW